MPLVGPLSRPRGPIGTAPYPCLPGKFLGPQEGAAGSASIKPMEAKIARKYPVILHQNCVVVKNSLSMETEHRMKFEEFIILDKVKNYLSV